MNGISIFTKQAPESCLVPSTTWGHCEKASSMNQTPGLCQDTEYASPWILEFSALRTRRNLFLLPMSHPVYDFFYSSPNRLRHSWRPREGCGFSSLQGESIPSRQFISASILPPPLAVLERHMAHAG
jgi:hypothetical protein